MNLGVLIVLCAVVMLFGALVLGNAFVYGLIFVMAVMLAYLFHITNRLEELEEKLDQLLETHGVKQDDKEKM